MFMIALELLIDELKMFEIMPNFIEDNIHEIN